MKKTIYSLLLAAIVLFTVSCELEEKDEEETYDNDYARKWYKTSEINGSENLDVEKLKLSDQLFEISEAEMDSDADISEYSSRTRGSIREIDGKTLRMTVEKKYYEDEWLNYEEYIELQEDLGVSNTTAVSLADGIYISSQHQVSNHF